jgi:glycosyltransferase 2 family protein
MRMRWVLRSVGLIIAVLGVLFVTRELVTSWPEVREAVAAAHVGLLGAALAVGSAGLLVVGLGWRRCLVVLGQRHPARATLRWYYLGQLGKYVPGGIWTVLGRGELARRGGVPGSVGYGSIVLSLGVTYLAGIGTIAVVLATGATGHDAVPWQPVLVLLPLGLLALHPRVVTFALGMARRLLRRELPVPVPRWRVSVGLLAWHVPAWLAIGTATWLVALALDPGTPDVRNLMFATVLSWVVGFLVVPAPGGLGVREAVFVAAAVSLSTTGVAAAVAVVARVVFILVDLLGAAVASLLAAPLRADQGLPDASDLPRH